MVKNKNIDPIKLKDIIRLIIFMAILVAGMMVVALVMEKWGGIIMKTYAGIGSRDIPLEERTKIIAIADNLCGLDYIVYSGNANGADVAFQLGSNGQCVVFLPWARFNFGVFEPTPKYHLDHFIVGGEPEGLESVYEFHPNPKQLTAGARKLMARNYYQIHGYKDYPKVDFVMCCADQDNLGNVKGGTGQAVRIAKSMNIPIINIRTEYWEDELHDLLNPIF